ncbi:MAG TPA: hypothetical protein VLT33_33350 [Labilithrix sp.]|nr:hypothetical protein [Labilithrix sp.]
MMPLVRALALAAATSAALLAASCSTSSTPDTPASAASCVEAASAKLSCPVLPGEFPPPDCQPAGASDAQCTGGGCAIDEAKCGSASTCMPLGDNRGRTVLDFRIRRLNIAAPDSLAALDFQAKVTIPTIDLKSAQCGEHGSDSWAWLMRLDREKKTLTTGGAPPSSDPFALGYCFFNSERQGKKIAPAAGIPVRLDKDGTVFSSGGSAKLTMPLFVGGDPNALVLLPITDFAVRNVTTSAEDNCIGSFNAKALDGACVEDPAKCSKWRTAGAMAGYITLEDADGVDVSAFKQSLCSLLTKSKTAKCPRDAAGKISLQGDYCGATRKACDCRDSFWVAATFAASAVRIHDGSSVPECGAP